MRRIVLPGGRCLRIPHGWDRWTFRDALGRLRVYLTAPERDTTRRVVGPSVRSTE